METIMNYFDHIFMALPPTAEVQKAKEELLGMAEDRYHELKEQGKTENEAVGTVIEEFGNIDELVSELGLEFETTNLENQHFLAQKDVDTYLRASVRADRQLGLGVFLLFLSPVMVIFLGLLNIGLRRMVPPAVIVCVGVSFLLILVAVGLCLIIFSSYSRRPFRYMEHEIFRMDYSTAVYVEDEYKKQQANFVLHVMIGVALLIVGVIPLIMMGVFYWNTPLAVRGIVVDIFMILYGISIFNFIFAGMSQKRFKILRQTERFSVKVKEKRLKKMERRENKQKNDR